MKKTRSFAPFKGIRSSAQGLDKTWADRAFAYFLRFLASFTLLLFALVMVFFAVQFFAALKGVSIGMLFSNYWQPERGALGLLPFIYASLITSVFAVILATPLAIALGVLISDIAPRRLGAALDFIVRQGAAIPPVVYGFWGLVVVVPWVEQSLQPVLIKSLGPSSLVSDFLSTTMSVILYPFVILFRLFGSESIDIQGIQNHFRGIFEGPAEGVGIFGASLVLAIMILPSIASQCSAHFNKISKVNREAILCMGATPWEAIKVAVLSANRKVLASAILLALTRALGEAVIVSLLIGNVVQIKGSIFASGESVAGSILRNINLAEGSSKQVLLIMGAVLLIVTVSLHKFSVELERGSKND